MVRTLNWKATFIKRYMSTTYFLEAQWLIMPLIIHCDCIHTQFFLVKSNLVGCLFKTNLLRDDREAESFERYNLILEETIFGNAAT